MNKHLQVSSFRWLNLFLLLLAQHTRAQLLTDDFNATTLPYVLATPQGGWTTHSGSGSNSVQVTAPGLSYTGVVTSGGAATLATSGEDVSRSFTQQTSGSVYASFLVNVTSAQAAGDYFLHFGPATIGTTFVGRVFVKSVAGGIQFGVSKGSDPAGPVYAGTTYATGMTYLLVLKYTFVSESTTNDRIELFVNPTAGQAEPSPAATATSTVADLTNVGTVALRQGTATSAAALRVDYLRVGTSWADVTRGSTATGPALTANPNALSGFTTRQGVASGAQSFTVDGRSLTTGGFTATAPAGYELSLSESTSYVSQLTVGNQPDPFSVRVYTRLTANLPAGPVNGSISLTGSNSTSATVPVSGIVTALSGYMPIAAARASVGKTVTIQGRVTVSNQFGSRVIYVQDETAGIAVYSGPTGTDLTTVVQLGDLLQLSGPVSIFNGSLQVNGVSSYTVVAGAGTVVPAPVTIQAGQLANYQGRLVRITDATISPEGSTLAGNTNYTLLANGQSATLRINGSSPLAGAGRPANPVTVTGIADRFISGAITTGTDGLQIQPRILADLPGSTAAQDQRCGLPVTDGVPVDQTLDIATWNMEFFGADAGTISCPQGTLVYNDQGPVNEDLQQANAATVLGKLNADIIAVQEVSDVNRLQAAVSSMPGQYSYVCSDKFSYFFQNECDQTPSGGTVFGPTRFAQKVCVIYNRATVTPLPAESRPLLLGKFPTYTYPSVPGVNGSGTGWSSGRLPYLFVANVTINGVTKKVHVVALHGKSGSTKEDFDRRTQDYNDLKADLDATYPDANLVVLGDFNDKATTSIYTSSTVSSFNSFVTDGTNYNVLTRPLELQGCSTFISSASFIDHIIVSNELQPAYLTNSAYVLQPASIPNYRNTTSDHNPVVSRFDISKIISTAGGPLMLQPPLYDCQTGAITFRTSGGDGTPIEFYGQNITSTWTTQPNQIIALEKRANPGSGTIVTLRARQSGREVSLDFDFGGYCKVQGGNLPPLVNQTLPAQTGQVGQFFSFVIPATTFTDPESQPLALSASGLPRGLSLTNAGSLSLVSGMPTRAGSYTVIVKASDPQSASATTPLLITILPPPGGTLEFANAIPNQTGTVGQRFSFRIPDNTFIGAQAAIEVSDLPKGLGYFADRRTIEGTPEAAETRSLTVTAFDGYGNQEVTSFSLTISPANSNTVGGGNPGGGGSNTSGTLAIGQTIPDQTGRVGQSFSFRIPDAAFTGTVSTIDVSDLPRGLAYYSDRRTIEGTPAQTDTRRLTVTASNGSGNRVQTTFTLTITSGARLPATPEPGTFLRATLLPNPVGEEFVVRIEGAQQQTVRFTLTDSKGAAISDLSVDVTTSVHQERLRLNQRPSGLYLLRIGTDRQTTTLKVVKQ